MCLTVHTGNQKSASTSWNRGQDSRGIEVLPFLRLSFDRRFPTFYLCLPRERKRALLFLSLNVGVYTHTGGDSLLKQSVTVDFLFLGYPLVLHSKLLGIRN